MAESKIEIKVGAVSFSGEGDGKWLSEQLDKILDRIPQLTKIQPTDLEDISDGRSNGGDEHNKTVTATLPSFLGTKNAKTQQVRKFLATAIWLHDRENRARLTTSDVTKTLAENHQSRLGNPANCLNQNVKKGFCEKSGKQFFVTEDGRNELG